jgi:carboxypeptidase family protein
VRIRFAFLFFVLAAPLQAQGRITGTVFDSLITNAPLAQATVMVVGTGLSRVTDARGRFQIDSVPAGRVQLTFFHPALDSVGMGAGTWDFDVATAGESEVKLGTPSAKTLRGTLCPGLADSTNTGLLLGRVRDVDRGEPITGAHISTKWLEVVFGPRGPSAEKFEASAASLSSGAFALCAVPLDVPVFVRASIGDQVSGPVEIFANSRPVLFQDLAISLSDSTARLSVDSALNAAPTEEQARPPGTASLTGSVRDLNGRPVGGARVALHGGGGTVVANRDGTFRLADLPAGTQTLDVRAIGFTPARHAVHLASSASTDVNWALDRRAAQLPTVRVLGGSRLDRNGFRARARAGHGSFLNEAQIAAMGGATGMDVLRRAPGLTLEYRTISRRTIRVPTLRSSDGRRCVPNLFVDGGIWMDGWDQVGNFLMKADILAIEVYASTFTIPPQFDRHTSCGSVVIWTRP